MEGILLKKRFIFKKNISIGYRYIPKTATTSIKHALYELRTGKKFSSQGKGHHIHNFFRSFNPNIDDAKFKFIVLRDPIKRFLSAYSNRVTHHKELSENILKKSKNGRKLLENSTIPIDPNLHEFLEFFAYYKTIRQINHHTKPVTCFVETDLSFFDKVYKIENTQDLENDISLEYNTKFILARKQTGGKKFSLSDIKKSELDFLLDYYAEDYELMKDYYSKVDIIKEWELEEEKMLRGKS